MFKFFINPHKKGAPMLRELFILLEELTGEIVKYDETYNQIKIYFIKLFSCQALTALPAISITFSPAHNQTISGIVDSMNHISILSMLKLFANWGLLQPDIRTKFLSLITELEKSENKTKKTRMDILDILSETSFTKKFENWNDYCQYTNFIPDFQLAGDVDMFIKEQAMKEIKSIVLRVKSNVSLFNVDKYYLISLCSMAGIDCSLFDFNELLKTTTDEWFKNCTEGVLTINQFIDHLDWITSRYFKPE